MIEVDPQSPPKNSREIGIHLVYMSKAIEDLKVELNRLSNNYATKQELLDAIKSRKQDQQEITKNISAVDDRLTRLEKVFESITTRIAGMAITFLALMILAQYGLDKFLRG